MTEIDEMRNMMLEAPKLGARLWRNNNGKAIVGDPKIWVKSPERIACGPGDVVVRNARMFHAGFGKGSADLIGIVPVVVTQEMVGQTIGVFVAVEAKAEGKKIVPGESQDNFVALVNQLGGIGGAANSVADAVTLLRRYS